MNIVARITHDRKCGRKQMVWTDFLNFTLVISFKRIAKNMDSTIVSTSFPTAMVNEFRNILAVSGSSSMCLKLASPTHLDFKNPIIG